MPDGLDALPALASPLKDATQITCPNSKYYTGCHIHPINSLMPVVIWGGVRDSKREERGDCVWIE